MKFKKIYVYCPNDSVTGGPDALHQMFFYLNRAGFCAEMVYFAFSRKHQYAIPEAYQNYISSFSLEKDVIDESDYAVILPESAVDRLKDFKRAKVFIWWLSVDNNCNRSSFWWKIFFFATLPARVVKNFDYYRHRFGEAIVKTLQKRGYSFKSERENVSHLCASYYAFDYVSKRTQKDVALCIEPISKFFLDKYEDLKENLDSTCRSDKVLYNPRKSGTVIQKLAAFASDIEFEPLVGLNQDQLVEKYKSSKLYIDFGPFPGAERIPKEAVLFGCSVITGRNGASNFYGDVPIPDDYKFGDWQNQMTEICQKIRDTLASYESVKSDCDSYRNTVLKLEENFMTSLKEHIQ